MDNDHIILPLKKFLLIEACPPEWKDLDLYLFRDEAVVFYVGQSQLAFGRVWEHLLNGFKGHSLTGRFVWVNWPKSMNFTIELLWSGSGRFAPQGYDLSAAEAELIRQYTPCFNISLNSQPVPLPGRYLPANAPFRRRRSLNAMVHEAERSVKIEATRSLLEDDR